TVEIEALVRDIQTETQDAVKTMESQTREVENGTKQVSSAGDALGNIVDVSVDSSTLAEQISSSAAEQERRAEAVLASVRSINKIAEETREKTVDFQKTSDQLAQLANELNGQLANFEIDRDN
ncbi:MAG: methyl-accepting chemotaxis protein, partial [Verrucomicrobiota bacterium]